MSDNVTDITVSILIDIRDGIAALNHRVDGVVERLDGVGERLDHLIEAGGHGRRDHEQRITRLESRVDELARGR